MNIRETKRMKDAFQRKEKKILSEIYSKEKENEKKREERVREKNKRKSAFAAGFQVRLFH